MLERPVEDAEAVSGAALARVVEAHPDLEPLLDFVEADPAEIAHAVGMLSPHEEDAEADLADLDMGEAAWYEPSAGLAAVGRALAAVRAAPQTIAAAIYDPGLRPADVLADLEAIVRVLDMARQHETRFHFVLEDAPPG